jgi:hypothetical protein
MRRLEEQIDWLSNYITYLYFLKEIYSNGRIKIEGITADDSNKEIDLQIIEFNDILKSLEILLERQNILQCENCVLKDLPF